MDGKNIYDNLMKAFGKIPKNISILEDPIDIKVQMNYFEISQKYKKNRLEIEDIKALKRKLDDSNTSDDEKKEALTALANSDDIEAYRVIEKFNETSNNDIKAWVALAMQESRTSIESYLLNEDQIIISTGLGGKSNKLRFFLAFSTKTGKDFTDLQQRLLNKELEFSLKNNDGEIENLEFNTHYCLLIALLPIHISIKKITATVIDECNQIGDFLEKKFIVTNVKVLSLNEIKDHWDDDKIIYTEEDS